MLLDINMPGMSGMDLLPQISTRYPDVAVIMLSGFDELSTAVWCMGEGAYDYIDKPVSLSELAMRVEKALSHRALVVNGRSDHRRLELMAHELDKRLEQRQRELKDVDDYLRSQGPSGPAPEEHAKLRAVVAAFCGELEGLARLAKKGPP